MGRNGQKDVGQTKVVRGARYVQQSIITNTPFYDDNLAIIREYIPDESVDLVYLGPRWTWLWPGGCGGGIQGYSPASVLMVNVPLTSSQSHEVSF
jgi:hypothetical protein